MTDDLIPHRRARAPGARQDLTTITVPLETITPIVGGAAVPRTLDDHDPIRVPSIRGQLRFWWRALYGHGKSPGELARQEAELWGGVHAEQPTRSQVAIWISRLDDESLHANESPPRSPELYALWPAAENKRKGLPAAPRRRPGVRFELVLRFPGAIHEPLERTLRAWILFGGVGARTRRGCGSVTVQEQQRGRWLPARLESADLRRLLGDHVFLSASHDANDTPSLRAALLLHGNTHHEDGLTAWTDALHWLRAFRQAACPRGDAPSRFARARVKTQPRRNKPPIKRPGRSHWPEPDKIRHLLARGRNHRWAHAPVHDEQPVWPRASFGLPIVGRFQDKDIAGQKYHPPDPGDFELCWQDASGEIHDRLASPLVLKALPLADGSYVPMALWLERAYPQGGAVVLRRDNAVVARSAAPFDRLRAKGDTLLYEPLEGAEGMKDAFVRWLLTEKKLTQLGGRDS